MPPCTVNSVGVVVPVCNESLGLLEFHRRLMAVLSQLPCQVNVWYVDDGSRDDTNMIIEQLIEDDPRIHLIELSRNFGHQPALTAGLDHAWGDVIITLDGDGQHPPELIPEMLELYKAGNDIVLGQRRTERSARPFKRLATQIFYWLINRIGEVTIVPGAADFRLMSQEAVAALRQLPEYHRFIRGLVSWLGFKQAVLAFDVGPRIAGRPQYSLRKLWELASNAIFSFSTVPLKISVGLGIILLFLSIVEGIYTLLIFFSDRRAELASGWASLMFTVLCIGGVQLVLLGVIGQYLGFIFQEAKQRPVYIIRRKLDRS